MRSPVALSVLVPSHVLATPVPRRGLPGDGMGVGRKLDKKSILAVHSDPASVDGRSGVDWRTHAKEEANHEISDDAGDRHRCRRIDCRDATLVLGAVSRGIARMGEAIVSGGVRSGCLW